MKLLLYCCKNNKKKLIKKDQVVFGKRKIEYIYDRFLLGNEQALNGKIVAECDYEVEEIEHYVHYEPEVNVGIAVLPEFECDAYSTETLCHFKLVEKSCLYNDQLDGYLKGKNGYAIHIKNLHIFGEPKELSDYCVLIPITKAPQNMMYVYDENSDNPNEKKVLISIRPEWLCKILNGGKTIEVRRKVLKEMLK